MEFAPVTTKPLLSTVTQRSNQVAFGSAPMNRKRWRKGRVSVARLTIAEHRRGEARALVSLQRNHLGSGMQLNIGERGNAYSTGPLEDRRLSGANA